MMCPANPSSATISGSPAMAPSSPSSAASLMAWGRIKPSCQLGNSGRHERPAIIPCFMGSSMRCTPATHTRVHPFDKRTSNRGHT